MGYNSGGYYVTVEMVDGRVFERVIVCDDPDNPGYTLLEASNGSSISVDPRDIDNIY